MKNRVFSLLLTVSVLLPALAISAGAQCAIKTLTVQVPFDFAIRGRQFPAGHYTLQQECERLYVRNDRAEVLRVFMTIPVDNGVAQPISKLVFFTHHGVHVLTSVFWERNSIGAQLTRPGQQVEVATRSLPSKPAPAGAGGRP